MKASELRELTVEELQAKLKDLKEELFQLRFQLAVNQLDNPMRISAVKRILQELTRYFVSVSWKTARRHKGGVRP